SADDPLARDGRLPGRFCLYRRCVCKSSINESPCLLLLYSGEITASGTLTWLPCKGSRKVKHVPLPTEECTSIWPLWLLVMMKYDTDSPSPVPWPISLVVKNGSKVRLRT